MDAPEEKTEEIQVAEEISTVSFELQIIDEKEPIKLTAAIIREKSKALTDLTIANYLDEAGYKAVKAATQKAIKTRTAIEKKEKAVLDAMKLRHADEKKEVTDYTAELYTACREAQTALEAKTTAIDNEKAAAAKKLADDLKAKTEGRENALYGLGMTFNGAAFVGYGKMIPKESLHGYTDEFYATFITELEALQLEQAVTGVEKPSPSPVMSINSITKEEVNSFVGSGYGRVIQVSKKPKGEYPTTVLDYVLENGQRILLTSGTIDQVEDMEVKQPSRTAKRILPSGNKIKGASYFN